MPKFPRFFLSRRLFCFCAVFFSMSARGAPSLICPSKLWAPAVSEAEALGMNTATALKLSASSIHHYPFYELARLSHFLRTAPASFLESLAEAINVQGKAQQPLDKELAVRQTLEKTDLNLSDDLIEYLSADLPCSRWTKWEPITKIDPIRIRLVVQNLSDSEKGDLLEAMSAPRSSDMLRKKNLYDGLLHNEKITRLDRQVVRSPSHLTKMAQGVLDSDLSDLGGKAHPVVLAAKTANISTGKVYEFMSDSNDIPDKATRTMMRFVLNCLGIGELNNIIPSELNLHLRKRLVGRADALRLSLASDSHEPARVVARFETEAPEKPSTEPAARTSKKERKARQSLEYQLRKAAGLNGETGRSEQIKQLVGGEKIEPVAPLLRRPRWSDEELESKLRAHALSESHAKSLIDFFRAPAFRSEKTSAVRLLQQVLELGASKISILGHASVQQIWMHKISEMRPNKGYSPIRIFYGVSEGRIYLIAAADKRRDREIRRKLDQADQDWIDFFDADRRLQGREDPLR